MSSLLGAALVYDPKCGGRGGENGRASANENSCTHGAQINFGDLTPYLTYAPHPRAGSNVICPCYLRPDRPDSPNMHKKVTWPCHLPTDLPTMLVQITCMVPVICGLPPPPCPPISWPRLTCPCHLETVPLLAGPG
jgi:hypothetical protein